MLTRLLLVLFLVTALQGTGCAVEEEMGFFKPVDLSPQSRQDLERLKREFLQLEEIKIGKGPIAAIGRKVTADIEVRYADGTVVYRGPAISYYGMDGFIFIHNNMDESGILSTEQIGIILGVNGMAIGGKRRITVLPGLTCGRIIPLPPEEAAIRRICSLILRGDAPDGGRVTVRNETLIVEATLTAACIPGYSVGPIMKREIRCRDSEEPRRDPHAPIWRIY